MQIQLSFCLEKVFLFPKAGVINEVNFENTYNIVYLNVIAMQ